MFYADPNNFHAQIRLDSAQKRLKKLPEGERQWSEVNFSSLEKCTRMR